MTWIVIVAMCLVIVTCKDASAQSRQQQQFNFLRPSRSILPSSPITSIASSPQLLKNLPLFRPSPVKVIRSPASSASMTIITDTSPEVLQNIANTIQLMTVTDMVQNKNGGKVPPQIIAPIINNLLSSPLFKGFGPLGQTLNSNLVSSLLSRVGSSSILPNPCYVSGSTNVVSNLPNAVSGPSISRLRYYEL